jgi:hypothetical protein
LVAAQQVHSSPGVYILCFSFWDAKNLVDINLRGGLYAYSSSEACNEQPEQPSLPTPEGATVGED